MHVQSALKAGIDLGFLSCGGELYYYEEGRLEGKFISLGLGGGGASPRPVPRYFFLACSIHTISKAALIRLGVGGWGYLGGR